MSYKKLLGVILIVIGAMFALMLTTSYAWYSFEAGSTTFDAVTNNDDILVSFAHGPAINTEIAVPISSDDVDRYSDKNNFTIKVKDNVEGNDIVVTISLIDITIDTALKVSDLKIDLYYQGSIVSSASTTGNYLTSTTRTLGNVTLDSDIDNNFELRVYLLDSGSDQSSLMNKNFQAKIQVDVVSRLKTTINDFSNPDIYVSSITVDGSSSNSLPTTGLYDMTSSCTKGSNLSWDSLSKTITYNSGSYVNDSCSLTFTTKTDKIYLNQVEPGSYVQYIGTNGCDGKHCEGDNANYVSDMKMGYCDGSNYQFTVNGWRVGYIKDNSAYLISAGAPECVVTYMDSKSSATGTVSSLGSSYYYGSGYTFDSNTGKFSLTGVTSSTLAWSSNYESIIANTPYTCRSTSSTATCPTLYELTAYSSSSQGIGYTHYNYETTSGAPVHLARLNSAALKYCNQDFAYGGVCDENTAWAMKADDFQNIVGKALSSSSCYNKYSDRTCGYTNDLIDNGGYYWFATVYSSSSALTFGWLPNRRRVDDATYSYVVLGVRPVLRLESSVQVASGSGTYQDPYVIFVE